VPAASLLIAVLAVSRPVIVFPLDARGVAVDTAERATEELKKTLSAIPRIEVIDTKDVEKRLGVHLTEQARACEYDVFCLVEVGEILQSDQMIIGHVKRGPRDSADSDLELKLFVLDVAKAVVIDTLLWRVPGRAERGLEDAVAAATRKLFSEPNAELVLEILPPKAEIYAFGEALPKAKNGVVAIWPGTYHVVVRADGFQPLETKIVVSASGRTTAKLELQPDLLYVEKSKTKTVSPFDKTSRREGSGVSALEVPTDVDVDTRPSAFANPFAWSATGVGLGLAVVGVVLASGAQNDYNALSGDERYLITTPSSGTASAVRQDAISGFRTGSIVAGAGAVVAVGGLVWMLIDATISDRAPSAVAEGGTLSFIGARW
jgi:hypothetical protein